ncbi:hypothetical protein [Vibrio owensii]|uniref:hypothetical protein n=1 Tax=Vibrio harveyi group TaxID=717610 RepID=UPI003CC5FF26
MRLLDIMAIGTLMLTCNAFAQSYKPVVGAYSIEVDHASSFCHVMGDKVAKSTGGHRSPTVNNVRIACMEVVSTQQVVVGKQKLLYAIPLNSSADFCSKVASRYLGAKSDSQYIRGSTSYKNCMLELSFQKPIKINNNNG